MCLNVNIFGFVKVPCKACCLGLDSYAMRCEDDALYTFSNSPCVGCAGLPPAYILHLKLHKLHCAAIKLSNVLDLWYTCNKIACINIKRCFCFYLLEDSESRFGETERWGLMWLIGTSPGHPKKTAEVFSSFVELYQRSHNKSIFPQKGLHWGVCVRSK